eukprot:2224918-Amphidinium_carterae.1
MGNRPSAQHSTAAEDTGGLIAYLCWVWQSGVGWSRRWSKLEPTSRLAAWTWVAHAAPGNGGFYQGALGGSYRSALSWLRAGPLTKAAPWGGHWLRLL